MSVGPIESRLYHGRTLSGRADDEGRQDGWSDLAVEAILAIDKLTTATEPVPVSVVHAVLNNLKRVGYELPQALQQISRGLSYGSDQAVSSNRDQTPGVAEARDHLAEAARRAAELGVLLEAAQQSIAN